MVFIMVFNTHSLARYYFPIFKKGFSMSKSTKNTNSSNANTVADLNARIEELEIENKDLRSRLSNGSNIDVTSYVEPGDFARLNLPPSFEGHDTRESLFAASKAAQDTLSCADIMLGFWLWMASPLGLKEKLHNEIGKSHGIANPIGETMGHIRKVTKAFTGASKKARVEQRVKKAEADAKKAEADAARKEEENAALRAQIEQLLAAQKKQSK